MTGLKLFVTLLLWAGAFYVMGYAYGRRLNLNAIQIRAAIFLLVICVALTILAR